MQISSSLATTIFVIFCASVGTAETTNWMTEKQLNRYVERKMNGGKAYPVDIHCGMSKGKAYIRLDTVPFDGKPPFYRWQWVIAETEGLKQAIADIRLKKRPDLKYRAVKSMRFDFDGTSTTCAILYR